MQRYRSIYDANTPPGAPGMSGATAQQARRTAAPSVRSAPRPSPARAASRALPRPPS